MDKYKDCQSIGDVLRRAIEIHNLDNWSPGKIVRSTIISGIENAIKTLMKKNSNGL